jgi:anthranilate synthase component I
VVPVWTEVLADLETPVAAFVKLVGDGPGFLLESVEHGERWSRFSFVGRNPSATLVLRDGVVEVDGDLPSRSRPTAASSPRWRRCSPSTAARFDDLPPLHGGMMGYLGYDVIREVEHLPDVPARRPRLPDAVMAVIGSLAAFDHWRQRVSLIESVPTIGLTTDELDAAYDAAGERVAAAIADLARPLPYVPVEPPRRDDDLPELRSSMPDGGQYQRAVEVAKEHILDGDIFQVVLAQRYDLELGADPFDVYRVLRQVNPSPYMYFLRHPEITIVGSSPEPMVQVLAGGRIPSRWCRPIAGTRKRGHTTSTTAAGRRADRAPEGACRARDAGRPRSQRRRTGGPFGTVHVDELMTLERYSHVMHMTSQVSGDLVDGLGPIDVLRATLPAGTVSGAPKVRAMEIIDDLEPVKRGPYAGVVGYVDWSGNLDTAIAIRTMFVRGDGSTDGRREPAGRRRHRGRLGARRRGPRVPQQGRRRCWPRSRPPAG